jgi:amino acid adenylation domain-containing protein
MTHGSTTPGQPRNFVEHLQALAANRPDDTALLVVGEHDDRPFERRLGYAMFEHRVRALAASLQARLQAGDRVLVMLDNDECYAIAMFACFYAGVIAVPAFPPESSRPQHLARLAGMAADAQAGTVLTSASLLGLVSAAAREFGIDAVIAVDKVDPDAASAWRCRWPEADDIAFLQYTSGSTSAPKGVMVSHGNLMANERAIREGLGIGADDKFATWSPLFHDMGLIGGLLQPFYSGIPCVLMSPRFFLERPVRWLETISRHRATISGGPDFAYRLCLERVKDAQLQGLDLSSWRVAYTGAEPVRHDTMEEFVARYAASGFGSDAVYPCYGLAEATLFVTGVQRGAGMAVRRFGAEGLARSEAAPATSGRALVACGHVPSAHELRIVDPQAGAVLQPGQIGEIWAGGPSIATGYWRNPEASAATFVERDGQRWLRTGDLGFMHDGHLYVAGRIKDMIIVRGHNVYPQDIERAIEAEVEAVRKGRVAAFAVELGAGEGIGVAAEVSRGLQKLVAPQAMVDAIGAAVGEQCGEAPVAVALLNPGAMPRTSSGKLQRAACRQGWIDRSLDAYALYAHGRFIAGPAEGTEGAEGARPVLDGVQQALADLWREVLEHDADRRYDADASFFGCGGNSLSAVRLAARIARHWSIDFPVREVFERPRLSELAAAVRRARDAGGHEPAPVIPVLPRERRAEPLPLSHGQERLWMLWRLDPTGAAYHVSVALQLEGALQANALRAALCTLIERHEALRTVFQPGADGTPMQRIQPAFEIEVPVVDVSGIPADMRVAHAKAEAQRLQRQPFDLARGPLMRVALIRFSQDTHHLVIVMHHIVCDGASMQVLVDELAVAYAAHVHGQPADLPAAPIQYADYALWQRAWLTQGAGARQLAWWRGELGDEHPVLALPCDHPRTADASYREARHAFELPAELLAGLRHLSQGHGATLFMALLAGFQALLHRYTGQHDIRVGVPVANRQRPETAGVVGFFVNTLVLRAVVDGRTTLAQLLERARRAMLGAQAHQDLPFEQLVQSLQPSRSAGHNPLFQVAFNHLPQDEGQLQAMPGLAARLWPLEEDAAQFELTLDTREHADGRVTAALRYARELFEPQTIERLARHYTQLLQALASHPEQPLRDVDLLSPAERDALLALGAPAPQPVNRGACIHQMFEAHAARRPDSIALVFGTDRMSYAELNARANRLAHWLLGQGVGPEATVGVALKRSPAMVVALLAILKTGAAYVPMDPDYPAQRLAYLLADSGVRLLLTDADSGTRVPDEGAVPRVDLDALDLGAQAHHDPAVRMHASNLAYVIYTSGSTGHPKGAQVCHHNVVRLLDATREWFRFDDRDVWTLFHSYAFDFSVWEIFGALCHGGQLVIVPHETCRAPDDFLALLRRHRVTVLNQTPSAFRQLLQLPALYQEDQTSLRLVIFGGEALEPQSLRPWLDHFGDAQPRLVNMYGITETTVHVTYRPITEADAVLPTRSPVGGAIPDLGLRVLDADMNLVPPGVAGELYVAGAGLARGYLHRAGLSAERFVADPFDGHGGRLYRSGDLVRQRADGELEYLGRVDHQVKVRGHRIELGEVQGQLLAQPGVRQALVLARAGSSGTELVAYVVADPSLALGAQPLRDALRTVLPYYMVPAAITVLEAFPLTANGKIDRRALPAPQLTTGSAHVAPAEGIEQAIAQVWCELLGTQRVGRHDNFFEIGGHSLLLMKAHRLLEERLSARLNVVDLFRHPTIESLAAFIERGAASDALHRTEERARRQRTAFLPKKAAGEKVTP